MKSGLKNCDDSGNNGPINNQRSQKLVDDYYGGIRTEYPDDWEQQPFDGKVMYNLSGGMPHGHMAIADGALKKVDIVDAAKVLYGKLEMEIPIDDDVSEHPTDGSMKAMNQSVFHSCFWLAMVAAATVDGSSHASAHIDNVDTSNSQDVA